VDSSGGAGGFRELNERYDGYEVCDAGGDKIGAVDTTYVNEPTSGSMSR